MRLTKKEKDSFLQQLENRFETNMHRHPQQKWKMILAQIEANDELLIALFHMETTGGEIDVVDLFGRVAFVDFSKETPTNRRNLCYDEEALISRKKLKPKSSALTLAQEMKVKVLDEKEYRYLQTIEPFDLKTSSWIKTPDKIRKLGGALFMDFRYNTAFTYHNGAESYYSARGFRCKRYLEGESK
ncbi:MAG: DUF4256 domain-containing protein [Anaerorhabdus sp.]